MISMRNRAQTRFVVLAPPRQAAPLLFRNIRIDTLRHVELVAEMQRFRGKMYLRDGAIDASDLTQDGRHKVAVDDRAWHVLSLDKDGRVCACLRYLDETQAPGFDDLWVRHAALSSAPGGLGKKFRRIVENRLAAARDTGMRFGEVGGWAVAEEHRGTLEPLRIILATYGLLELMGGALGVATATVRHDSASILRRIGLSSLGSGSEEMPEYFDPQYDCKMQMLQFDSRFPNPRYEGLVHELAHDLTTAPVYCRDRFRATLHSVLLSFDAPPTPAMA